MKTTPNQSPVEAEVIEAVTDRIHRWHLENDSATLTEIEEVVDAELAQLRRCIVEGVVNGKAMQDLQDVACPECEQRMVKNGKRKRQLQSKGGETLRLNRQQMRCLHCGTTRFPPG